MVYRGRSSYSSVHQFVRIEWSPFNPKPSYHNLGKESDYQFNIIFSRQQ